MIDQVSTSQTASSREVRLLAARMKKLRSSIQQGCCKTLREDYVSSNPVADLLCLAEYILTYVH